MATHAEPTACASVGFQQPTHPRHPSWPSAGVEMLQRKEPWGADFTAQLCATLAKLLHLPVSSSKMSV